MRFYDCGTAPSPRRVRIFIAEKGMDIETVEVDIRNGEHLYDSFRKINPHCTVPALELDDGTSIAEIPPICRYLEEIQPEPNLLGADPKERALISMWDRYMEFDGFMAVAEALRNSAKGMRGRALTGNAGYEQIPDLAERGRKRTERFFADLEARLGEIEAWRDRPVVVHCHHGGRSAQACAELARLGFSQVENLDGGIEAWSLTVDDGVPRY